MAFVSQNNKEKYQASHGDLDSQQEASPDGDDIDRETNITTQVDVYL